MGGKTLKFKLVPEIMEASLAASISPLHTIWWKHGGKYVWYPNYSKTAHKFSVSGQRGEEEKGYLIQIEKQ